MQRASGTGPRKVHIAINNHPRSVPGSAADRGFHEHALLEVHHSCQCGCPIDRDVSKRLVRVQAKEKFLEDAVKSEFATLRNFDRDLDDNPEMTLGGIDTDYIEKWGKVEKPKLGDLT